MLAKDELGKLGEDLAARHLVGSGFEILARNWRCDVGEVDIVARDHHELVIVEVKTRSTAAFGLPAEAVNARKVDKLKELALTWLQENPGRGRCIRFDVISVVVPKHGPTELQHFRAAF